jgi:hypothetical protein
VSPADARLDGRPSGNDGDSGSGGLRTALGCWGARNAWASRKLDVLDHPTEIELEVGKVGDDCGWGSAQGLGPADG